MGTHPLKSGESLNAQLERPNTCGVSGFVWALAPEENWIMAWNCRLLRCPAREFVKSLTLRPFPAKLDIWQPCTPTPAWVNPSRGTTGPIWPWCPATPVAVCSIAEWARRPGEIRGSNRSWLRWPRWAIARAAHRRYPFRRHSWFFGPSVGQGDATADWQWTLAWTLLGGPYLQYVATLSPQ